MCDSMDGRVLDPRSPISQYLEMPYMWSLASQGTNFVNMYTNSPQCSPSRTSMFTGRHLHRIKSWDNSISLSATPGSGQNGGNWELDQDCLRAYDKAMCQYWAEKQNVSDTFMDVLTAGGVNVALHGKVDVGANVVHRPDQKAYDPTVPGFHGGPLLAMFSRAADIRRSTKARPVADENVPTQKIHAPDWKITSACMKWLEENPNRAGPWMLYCSINIPHPAYKCNADTEAHVSKNISLPEWFTNPTKYSEGAMHPYNSYMSFSKEMMDEQGKFTAELLKKNMRCWYAMVNQTDLMLGQVWEKAAATGNLKNTLVIFTSDHGEMHMEHRQHLKNTFYEGSERVPLLLAGPGSRPGLGTRAAFNAGHQVTDLVSLLDMYPTFVDAAGGKKPADLDGSSLIPYLTGAPQQREDHVVAQYMSNMANTNGFMIRKGPWKYIAFGKYGPSTYKNYAPQLFNLEEDPFELRDVSLSNRETCEKLDKLLRRTVDYDVVDREIKMEERMLFDRYFPNPSMSQWRKTYKGFDQSDYQKIQEWLNSTESAPGPKGPARKILDYGGEWFNSTESARGPKGPAMIMV